MLRIRLRRHGARKQPTYRIVVADQRHARDGRFVEIIGHYNPRTEPSVAQVDEERAFHWLGNGARPSEAVARIFGWTGTQERFLRLKGGEEISKLLAEASKAASERPAPTQTRRDAPEVAAKSKSEPEDESVEDESVEEKNEPVLKDGDGESDEAEDEKVISGSKADSEAEGMVVGANPEAPADAVADVSVGGDLEQATEEEPKSKAEGENQDV